MKRVLVFLTMIPSLAAAQNLPPAQPVLPEPPAGNRYRSVIHAHRLSPSWTQDRSFTSTRFWLVDPGVFEFQSWVRAEAPRGRGATSLLFQQEVEIGLWPHLQLDLYENLSFDYERFAPDGTPQGSRSVSQEGNQIELRIAIPSYYGQIFANPVIYLEWRPRHSAPDRAEARLLLGGELLPRLYLAVNLIYEVNVEGSVRDQEAGASVGVGYGLHEKLRLGFEARGGGDQLGSNTWHGVAYLGPSVIWKPLGKRLKLMGSWLFGLTSDSHSHLPTLIVGTQL